MPIELVWFGGILVIAAGVLMFVLIRRRKPTELPHI